MGILSGDSELMNSIVTTLVREDFMLVLSRKRDEEIVIAGHIRVRVLELRGGRVRLGVSAPPDVTVDRAEVLPRDAFATGGQFTIPGGDYNRTRSVAVRAG